MFSVPLVICSWELLRCRNSRGHSLGLGRVHDDVGREQDHGLGFLLGVLDLAEQQTKAGDVPQSRHFAGVVVQDLADDAADGDGLPGPG
jgi:hypothetical protein